MINLFIYYSQVRVWSQGQIHKAKQSFQYLFRIGLEMQAFRFYLAEESQNKPLICRYLVTTVSRLLCAFRRGKGFKILGLSQHNKRAQIENESEKAFLRTKEYVWHQNKDYVGGATC